jgi:hypothetical protein
MNGAGIDGVLGTLAELFTWVGLGVGLALGLAWLVVRAVHAGHDVTEAELVEGETPRLRWLTQDGQLCERDLEGWERAEIGDADGIRVRYRRSRPESATLAHLPQPGSALRVLALVFLGIGAVAWVGSIVLMLVVG